MRRLNIAMLSQQTHVVPNLMNYESVENDLLLAHTAMEGIHVINVALEDAIAATQYLLQEDLAFNEALKLKPLERALALESIQRNIDRIAKDVGYGSVKVIGLESDGDSASGISDKIKNLIKTIWGAITATWNKVVNFIKEVFDKFFQATSKIKSSAQKILSAASKMRQGVSGGAISVSTNENRHIGRYIRSNGDRPGAYALAHLLKQTNDFAEKMLDACLKTGGILELSKNSKLRKNLSVSSMLADMKKVEEDLHNNNNDGGRVTFDSLLVNLEPVIKQMEADSGQSSTGIYEKRVFTKTLDLSDAVYSLHISELLQDFYLDMPLSVSHESVSLQGLDAASIKQACEAVIEHMTALDGYKPSIKDIGNHLQELEEETRKMAENSPINDLGRIIMIQQRIMTHTVKLANKIVTQVPKHSIQLNKAVVDYCNLSLRAL